MELARHGHVRSSSASTSTDSRPSYLDVSALSPAEHGVFVKWLTTISPSRSGKANHVDEQDALRFLREECGIEVQDEIKILSLFERFPLGLLPGHFFALLRLASWVQRGEGPTKAFLFTQTPPPKIGLNKNTAIPPPPQHASTSSPRQVSHTVYSSPKASKPIEISSSPTDQIASEQQHRTAAAATVAMTTTMPIQSSVPPPVPEESSKPANPFRQSAPPLPSTSSMLGSAILGFDPAPNPFKQSKPKLVRPTPIVADASTSVLGAPSLPAVNPFQSGHSAPSSVSNSPVSGRSIVDEMSGPPLPPRPSDANGADLRPPPPLPPRHISPLIQAGLHARSEVKKRQDALPPKTFTVLQSTSDKHHPKEAPRLLTGQAAPPPFSRKKSHQGSEPRRSITELHGSGTSAAGGAQIAKAGVSIPTIIATEHLPSKRVGPLPPTIAPKPSYVGKGKAGVPAWLREQEELQKSSLLDHHNSSSATPRDQLTQSRSSSANRSKKRTTSAAQRIQFLDNDSDEGNSDNEEGTLSEQARSAASIDRNNPFFQHSRDANKKGVDLKETLSKLAVENAVAKAERDSKYGGSKANSETSTAHGNSTIDNRPLGRSKTMRDSSRGGTSNALGPPMVPPRRKGTETFPATLNSGTYPGFGKSARVEGPTVGGLRQTPISKKADVGIPATVLAEREKMEKEKVEKPAGDVSSRSMPMPPPPPRRRPSSNSQISVSDSSATTPRSPRDEMPPSLVSSANKGGSLGLRERVSELLKGDLKTLSERHDWLARAAERAKGGPLNDSRVGLMERDDDEEEYDDAPEVDDDYLEERRREQRLQQRFSMIDMVGSGRPNEGAYKEEEDSEEQGDHDRKTPISRIRTTSHQSLSQRRATDHIRRSISGVNAAIVRRSSLLARGSSSFDDEAAREANENNSALVVDDDGVAPDVDTCHRRIRGSSEEESRDAVTSPKHEGWLPLS